MISLVCAHLRNDQQIAKIIYYASKCMLDELFICNVVVNFMHPLNMWHYNRLSF